VDRATISQKPENPPGPGFIGITGTVCWQPAVICSFRSFSPCPASAAGARVSFW
jgi:hypothetical protein